MCRSYYTADDSYPPRLRRDILYRLAIVLDKGTTFDQIARRIAAHGKFRKHDEAGAGRLGTLREINNPG
jgi:hypothetical protein